MNPTNIEAVAEIDIATVDQQIEQRALRIERIQREAIFEIGRELSDIRDLFKFDRREGGFEGWVDARLKMSKRTAYELIQAYELVSEKGAELRTLSKVALLETASAEPDIQSIIAERVAAGEVFTAMQVKEIKEAAEKETADFKAKLDAAEKAAVDAAEKVKTDAEKRIKELEDAIASETVADSSAPTFDLSDAVASATKAKDDEIAALKAKLDEVQNDPTMKAMRDAVADAAKNAGKPAKSRKNPLHNPNADVNRTLGITGPCRQLLDNAKKMKPADLWKGFHDNEQRDVPAARRCREPDDKAGGLRKAGC